MAKRSLTKNSTCVASSSYDDDTHVLEVSFVEGGGHAYFGVTPELAEGLQNASSKGSYFNSKIRPLDPGHRGPGGGGFRHGRKL